MGGWSALLGRKKFKASKLKTLLSLTVARLVVLVNQGHARCFQARSDIAQAIGVGCHDQALDHAEHFVRAQRSLDLFAEVDTCCRFLSDRASLLQGSGRVCPEQLREAIASLIYVASMNADLPELQNVRLMLALKLGSDFAAAAVDLRDGCGVSPKVIDLSSIDQPSLESKLYAVKAVATENGLPFDLQVNAEDVAEKRQSPPHMDFPNPSEYYLKKSLSESMRTNPGFRDAATAAEVAFNSADFAAAAAREATKLARSSHSGDQSSVSGLPGKIHHSETDAPPTSETEHMAVGRNHRAMKGKKIVLDDERIGYSEGTTSEPRHRKWHGVQQAEWGGQMEQVSETEEDEGTMYVSSSYSGENQLEHLREERRWWTELRTVEEDNSFGTGTDDDSSSTGPRLRPSPRSVRTRRHRIGGSSVF